MTMALWIVLCALAIAGVLWFAKVTKAYLQWRALDAQHSPSAEERRKEEDNAAIMTTMSGL